MATLLAGLAAAIPGSLCAQPHPEGGHPQGGGHPAPAMHAPAPAMHAPAMHAPASHFHATMGRPSSHHYARRPTTHYHRPTTHHVYHHATVHTHAVHHGHPTAVGRTHVSAKVAGLRRNVTAARRFHAGNYRAPPGYHYRRWGYGEFLPSIYWGRDYWLTDFLAYGLFAPPDGYIWVRYGPDALLIDQNTGEIIQVDYGVFY
jgi:Ni/Co efflux regulator RcnB